MNRSAEKLRAWQLRSKPLQRKSPMSDRTKPMPRVNRRRKAKRDAVAFADQADVCRYLACCACRRYGDITGRLRGNEYTDALVRDLEVAIAAAQEWRERYGKDARCSDPHHVVSRGAGGRDEHCVPLCRAHHREVDGVNSGPKTFEAKHGVNLRAIASAISNALKEHARVAPKENR